MKILALLLTLGTLTSTLAHAQYKLSGTGPIIVNCDFSKTFTASGKMTEVTKANVPVVHCTSNGKTLELAALGLKFATNEAFQKQATMSLCCTGDTAVGAYVFGGYPIGFASEGTHRSPWFYKVGGGSGRCSLEYNPQAVTGMQAIVNRSAIVLMEVSTTN